MHKLHLRHTLTLLLAVLCAALLAACGAPAGAPAPTPDATADAAATTIAQALTPAAGTLTTTPTAAPTVAPTAAPMTAATVAPTAAPTETPTPAPVAPRIDLGVLTQALVGEIPLQGTGEPGTTVFVYLDGAIAATADAGAGGAWAVLLAPVEPGPHVLTAAASDASGALQSAPVRVVVQARATETPTVTPLPTDTPTSTYTPTRTPTHTPTVRPFGTPTLAPTPTPSRSPKSRRTAEAASLTGFGGAIRISTQSPLSGPQSVLGTAIKNGAQLAIEQNGSILTDMGFSVELAPFDDQATPDTGVANAKQIVADPAILCVVGHLNSGVMIPSSEEYHNASLAAVSPANTNPLVTDRGYPEVNRIIGRDDVQGVVGAEFAFNVLGLQTVYVLHDKTAYGQGIAEFFRQHAEELGMEVLGFEGTEEQANFDSITTPILAANPDLVYFGGIYSQGGLLLKALREKGIQAAYMGPDGFDSTEMASLAGDAIVGVYYTSTAGPLSLFPKADQFITDYEARFGERVQPYAAEGFDSMTICLQAIQRAAEAAGGLPTRAQVAAEVRATAEYDGITGVKTFNEIGDLAVAKYFVKQVTSPDPAKWGENVVAAILDIPAPVGKR